MDEFWRGAAYVLYGKPAEAACHASDVQIVLALCLGFALACLLVSR